LASYQARVALTILTTESMTDTSMSMPTTVASTTLPATWCRSKCWRQVIAVEFHDDKAQKIAARASTRHDAMRGQRGFGRADPRIQVMPLPRAQAATPTVAAKRMKMTT
jgi:hypothetical protein